MPLNHDQYHFLRREYKKYLEYAGISDSGRWRPREKVAETKWTLYRFFFGRARSASFLWMLKKYIFLIMTRHGWKKKLKYKKKLNYMPKKTEKRGEETTETEWPYGDVITRSSQREWPREPRLILTRIPIGALSLSLSLALSLYIAFIPLLRKIVSFKIISKLVDSVGRY